MKEFRLNPDLSLMFEAMMPWRGATRGVERSGRGQPAVSDAFRRSVRAGEGRAVRPRLGGMAATERGLEWAIATTTPSIRSNHPDVPGVPGRRDELPDKAVRR